MSPAVKLSDLTDALDLPEEWSAWLDRTTGLVITLDSETLADGEMETEEDQLGAISEEQAVARAIADGDPRYLSLPDKFDFHEYRHMERFIDTIAEPNHVDQLWRAIKGKGAFRHFRDTADRLGVIDDWYRYRDKAIQHHMLAWAEANQVIVDQTPGRAKPV